MAKTLNETVGGIFCCQMPKAEPWCNDCPYEHAKDCRNTLESDISYWASKGKLEVGADGKWGLKVEPVQQKNKRKNGRLFFTDERRNNRQYGSE